MKKITLFFILGIGINSYCQAPGGGMTDIDVNTYNSVIIGTQEWTKQNLNVSKYSDGTIIPQVTDPTQWTNLTTGAWCYYNNTTANGTTYGKLYNWYAVAGIHDNDPSTPNKILAPTGWHIPSDDVEWSTLINYLDPIANGGYTTPNIAGAKMKETGTAHWPSPNTEATNSSGFTALPGGCRFNNGSFNYFGYDGLWWSSTEFDPAKARNRILDFSNSYAGRYYYNKYNGLSVRCIKDSPLNNQSFNNSTLRIYPNPAKEQITIDLGNTTNVNGWSYKITNTLGQEVIKGKIASQQTTINLNEIESKGMYFVKIYDAANNVVETKKLIVK